MEDDREWPIFRAIRKETAFKQAFPDLFGLLLFGRYRQLLAFSNQLDMFTSELNEAMNAMPAD